MNSYLITQILKTKKITDYLASKGIYPNGGEMNGKVKYNCPLHEGDNTPSFIVYLNGEYENYYCYGCRSRYNIIHLYRDLEKVSTAKAIESLSNGVEVDLNAELNHAIAAIEEDTSTKGQLGPPDVMLDVSRRLYFFLQRVEYDAEMTQKVDKLEKVLDDAFNAGRIDLLENIFDNLDDTLKKAVKLWDDKQEDIQKRIIQSYDTGDIAIREN